MAWLVSVKEHEEEVAEQQVENQDTHGVATDAVVQAAVQAPMALLGALVSTPLGPGILAGGAKMVVRNIPLVVLFALLVLLFWPSELDSNADDPEVGLGKPNGMHPPAGDDLHRQADQSQR